MGKEGRDNGGVSGTLHPRRPPMVTRKIDRRTIRFDNLNEFSLGSCSIGKVHINCKFRFSESEWGVLGKNKTPAGIIYVDIAFVQPENHLLDKATVLLSLMERPRKTHREFLPEFRSKRRDESVLLASRLAWHEFGPKDLRGPPISQTKRVNHSLTPSFSGMGFQVGGMGRDTAKTVTTTGQWALKGSHVAGDSNDDDDNGRGTFRTLRWDLWGNKLAQHPEHSNVICTGLAFNHDAKPFYIEVQIRGRLRKISDRLICNFPPHDKAKQGTALTYVQLNDEYKTGDSLDSIASGLGDTMKRINEKAMPCLAQTNAAGQQPAQPDEAEEDDAMEDFFADFSQDILGTLNEQEDQEDDEQEEDLGDPEAPAAPNAEPQRPRGAREGREAREARGARGARRGIWEAQEAPKAQKTARHKFAQSENSPVQGSGSIIDKLSSAPAMYSSKDDTESLSDARSSFSAWSASTSSTLVNDSQPKSGRPAQRHRNAAKGDTEPEDEPSKLNLLRLIALVWFQLVAFLYSMLLSVQRKLEKQVELRKRKEL